MDKQQEQIQKYENESGEDNNAYSLFLYGVRSPVTRDYYKSRLRIFFNYIKLPPDETMENRCNSFAAYARNNPNLVFKNIIGFLQFQRERVERKEIVGATLKNFVKPIKLFCEMSDIAIPWKKITRGLPKVKRYADDRAPTYEEIKKICDYPDRRMKALIFTMSSCGIRLGAWDYLQCGHINPIENKRKIIDVKASSRILSQSHIGRVHHPSQLSCKDPSSRRIFRQGFEFLEQSDTGSKRLLRAGQNLSLITHLTLPTILLV
jgi:hypothetical protein